MARSLERLYPYQFSVLPLRVLARMPHGGFLLFDTRSQFVQFGISKPTSTTPRVHFPTVMSLAVCNSNFRALIFALVGHRNPAVPLPTQLFHPEYVCCAVLCCVAAMQRKPVVTEVRTPTDTWSGLGFSKSMPAEAVKELRSISRRCYKPYLSTIGSQQQQVQQGSILMGRK